MIYAEASIGGEFSSLHRRRSRRSNRRRRRRKQNTRRQRRDERKRKRKATKNTTIIVTRERERGEKIGGERYREQVDAWLVYARTFRTLAMVSI